MRFVIRSAFALIAVCIPAPVFAQPIVVVSKPGNGGWDVSYTRVCEKADAATGTELSTTCKTLAAARHEAARLKKWSQSMDPKSTWRLKKIYIEGEEATAGPPKDAAPKTPTLLDQLREVGEKAKAAKDAYDKGKLKEAYNQGKEAYDKAKEKYDEAQKTYDRAMWVAKLLADPKAALQEKVEEYEKKAQKEAKRLGSTLKEYGENVAAAFQRAKELTDGMLKLDKNVMDRSFKKVNDAIAEYNKQADAGAKFFDGKGSPFPRMKPVGPQTVKAVDEWKAARKQQFDLETRKQELDRRKAALDRERDKLADEWKALASKGEPDPADPNVVSLRKRIQEYRSEAERYTTALSSYSTGVISLQRRIARLNADAANKNPYDENAPKRVHPLVGTTWKWVGRPGVEGTPRYEFRFLKDGRFEEYSKGRLSYQGTWRGVDDYALVKCKFDDGREFVRKVKASGNKLRVWWYQRDRSLKIDERVYTKASSE